MLQLCEWKIGQRAIDLTQTSPIDQETDETAAKAFVISRAALLAAFVSRAASPTYSSEGMDGKVCH